MNYNIVYIINYIRVIWFCKVCKWLGIPFSNFVIKAAAVSLYNDFIGSCMVTWLDTYTATVEWSHARSRVIVFMIKHVKYRWIHMLNCANVKRIKYLFLSEYKIWMVNAIRINNFESRSECHKMKLLACLNYNYVQTNQRIQSYKGYTCLSNIRTIHTLKFLATIT